MRALEKDPERRFESASAMLEALRSAHSSEASAETIDPAADTGPPAGTAKQQAPPPRPGSPDWLIPTDQSAAPGPGAAATPDAPPLDVAEVPDASSPRPPLEGGPPPEEAGQSSLATFHRTRTASFRERHSFGLWYWIILLALAFGAWKFGPPLVETVRLRYVLWQATEAVDPGTGRLRVRYDVEKRLTEAGFDPEALRLEVEVDYTEKLKLKSVAIGVDYERQVTYPGVDYTTVLPFRPSFRRSF